MSEGMFLFFVVVVGFGILILPWAWDLVDIWTDKALSNLLKAVLNRLQRVVEGTGK